MSEHFLSYQSYGEVLNQLTRVLFYLVKVSLFERRKGQLRSFFQRVPESAGSKFAWLHRLSELLFLQSNRQPMPSVGTGNCYFQAKMFLLIFNGLLDFCSLFGAGLGS